MNKQIFEILNYEGINLNLNIFYDFQLKEHL